MAAPLTRRRCAMLLCSFVVFPTFNARFSIGERFRSDLSICNVGSGDLTAEFDALFELSVR
jgi:hypothetical protein